MISLNNIIKNSEPSLTKSDKVICEFLLNNTTELTKMTLLDIAEKTYSSKSNVLRLIKKLGFSGFTDFKYYMLALGDKKKEQPSIDSITRKLKTIDLDMISNEFNTLINNAKNIYLFATGQDQQIQAKNLANSLLKVGIISTFVPLNINAELTNNIISSIEPSDLIIIFSSKGNNESLKSYFNQFNKKNSTIISFTAFKEGWIQNNSTLVISLDISQFQDPTLAYQSGMIHLLINVLSTQIKKD